LFIDLDGKGPISIFKEVAKVTLGISVGEDEGDFELDEGEVVGSMDGVIDSCFVGETEGLSELCCSCFVGETEG
jgi:hypothetical protein